MSLSLYKVKRTPSRNKVSKLTTWLQYTKCVHTHWWGISAADAAHNILKSKTRLSCSQHNFKFMWTKFAQVWCMCSNFWTEKEKNYGSLTTWSHCYRIFMANSISDIMYCYIKNHYNDDAILNALTDQEKRMKEDKKHAQMHWLLYHFVLYGLVSISLAP